MPDETITIQPDSHAAQVDKPAATPQAPVAPAPLPTPLPTIAIEPSSHSDQVSKDGFFATVKAAMMEAWGELFPKQEKTITKNEDGIDYMASDYAYVPDPAMPDTWRLRIADGSPGNITAAQIGRATAELSSPDFRAGPVEIPKETIWAVKRRIRDAYAKLGVKNSGFSVWKADNGQYRWLAVYSNNYRDNDNPPEIISEKSHQTFLALVKERIVPYPELWHWHIPGTRWGVADMLDYADGFALASGTIDAGHEREAEALANMKDVRVSHGMPAKFIMRSKDDPSVIDFHITSEISPLPGWAAANKLTDFVVFGGLEMALRDEQKEHLRKAGLDDERIAALEADLSSKTQTAQAAGIESKEADTPAETPAAQTEQPAYATQQEIADAMAAVTTPIMAALNEMTAKLGEMQAEVKALKEADESKIAEKAQATPRASLEELIAQSIVGKKEAQIDGRSTLAKARPVAQAADETPAYTPIGFLNGLMNQAQGGVQ